MHLFINSLAASAGGGLTYIRNVLPHLAAQPDLQVTVALPPSLKEEFGGFANVDFPDLRGSRPPFLVRAVGSLRPDSTPPRRRSAFHRKLCSQKVAGTANPAVAKFDLHFGGLLSRPAFPP